MMHTDPSSIVLQDLYTKMLLTRIVDNCMLWLYTEGYIDFVSSCRGHEATQVGSATCIQVGQDFTLPFYRDLGVVLTIGMTPYEIFRTSLQTQRQQAGSPDGFQAPLQYWGYHKHNTITGSAPVATQLLHAAGIAFACKLRKAAVVTVAYCGDDATTEPDFQEGIQFAAMHQLPVVFICEQDCTQFYSTKQSTTSQAPSCLHAEALPPHLLYQRIDGMDSVAVYSATLRAMQAAREGHGPTLLEMAVTRSLPTVPLPQSEDPSTVVHGLPSLSNAGTLLDPLVRCQHTLQERGMWNDEWATQLSKRMMTEVERALQDALRDTLQSK
ncbi:thiamine pyrophosphate-dependent dehydrogenase E1 component subunit alpha [Dictyobacter arantiisoli]|uniref:2-oxoisovalerate dehydrogenase subunit alpha n=1 Tax=Dictyobacter arantiisoli TaxID=2014874 RepID=A0A5A5THQ7_9CHLR|nr:thiamine pyrophosphate-dependent enzyme [Dictyobacter arantiisoli]GCF10559.1 2-oxoisovalerate dehydrogenase subunit alpha [Dictyobacter arantiisoli]